MSDDAAANGGAAVEGPPKSLVEENGKSQISSADSRMEALKAGEVMLSIPSKANGSHPQVMFKATATVVTESEGEEGRPLVVFQENVMIRNPSQQHRPQSLHPPTDETDHLPVKLKFTYLDACALVYSMTLYLCDVGSDIYLAYYYYKHERTAYFFATLAFIVFPAIIQTAISLRWYIHDVDNRDSEESVPDKISMKVWALRVTCLLLQLGLVLRYVDALCYGLKFRWRCKSLFNRKKREIQEQLSERGREVMYRLMIYEDADALLLRIFECFLEAIPQMLLQFYILSHDAIEERGSYGDLVVVVQSFSIITSLISVAWTLASYHRHMRFCQEEKKNITWTGTCLQICWFLCILISRTLALGLFATVFGAWVFMSCAIHWFIMSVFMLHSDNRFCKSKFEEWLFDLLLAFIYIFIFYNVSDEQTRYKYTFYYIITFVSNTIMISLWFLFLEPVDVWFRFPGFAGQFCSFFLGIFIMMIYYLYFHPTGIQPFDVSGATFFGRIKKPLQTSGGLTKDSAENSQHNNNPSAHTSASNCIGVGDVRL